MSHERVTRGGAAFLSLVVSLLLAACGALDQKSEGGSSQGSVSVQLSWPEGYAYDPAARSLATASDRNGKAAPSYVTRVGMKVSGADMEPILVDFPLDTLTATVTVTLGERTFALLVETLNGDTFTGSRTVVIDPGFPGLLLVPLEVNAPPVIRNVTMNPAAPKKGDTLTLAATADDPDPDDLLTYVWRGDVQGGGGTLTGQVVRHLIQRGGNYKITLTVDDDHGGTDSATRSFSVFNALPAIQSASVDSGRAVKTSAKEGDTLALSCFATDADDQAADLVYKWAVSSDSGATTILNGRTPNYPFKAKGDVDFTCDVRDADNAQAKQTVSVNNGQSPRDGGACSTDYNNGTLRMNIGWTGYTDLDAALSVPGGTKTWFGHLRPGNGTEQCTDVTCSGTGGGATAVTELFYFKTGTAPPAGNYTFAVRNMKNCSGGATSQNFTWFVTSPSCVAPPTGAGCLSNVVAGGVAVTGGCSGGVTCSNADGGAAPTLAPGANYLITFTIL